MRKSVLKYWIKLGISASVYIVGAVFCAIDPSIWYVLVYSAGAVMFVDTIMHGEQNVL